jgi:hypothetical protein
VLHATDAHLRRLQDEPLAVPDRVAEHLGRCPRCQRRLEAAAHDARRAARLLNGVQPAPDADAAWERLRRSIEAERDPEPVRRRNAALEPPRRARLRLRHGLAACALAAVLGGTAAAATLTDVFAPTRVAPVALNRSDVSALAEFMGVGSSLVGGQAGNELGGFPTSNGSLTRGFGTIRWTSSGPARTVPTLAAAGAAAGFTVPLATSLPNGVGQPRQFIVQPHVRVSVRLNPGVARIGGSSFVLDAGPAVLVEYGSAGGLDVPTLAILTLPRPTAVATGATLSQIEAFVLDRPGVPADLAQELRLLGDVSTTLPIPVPAGAVERSVDVGGSPGVLISDPSNVASGVVWEDSAGVLHAVAGLVDQKDVLDVAAQIG